jgi:hypothetical protein
MPLDGGWFLQRPLICFYFFNLVIGPRGYEKDVRMGSSPDFFVKARRLVGPQPLRLPGQGACRRRSRATLRVAALRVHPGSKSALALHAAEVLVALARYFVKEPDLVRDVFVGPGEHDQTVPLAVSTVCIGPNSITYDEF